MTDSTTWIICGAGRGVGKTHLAQSLCDILPKSLYAKHGCGRRRPDGPANFFHTLESLDAFLAEHRATCEHIVIESNECARGGRGDIVVFIEGVPDRTDVRDDVGMLRKRADVNVSHAEGPVRWRPVLQRVLRDAALVDAVCGVLSTQRRHLFGESRS